MLLLSSPAGCIWDPGWMIAMGRRRRGARPLAWRLHINGSVFPHTLRVSPRQELPHSQSPADDKWV
jgi:hypothetical protein